MSREVSRTALQRYPDLLRWFDNIAPSNVDLEITFGTGELTDSDYQAFRRKYNIMSSLGSSGYNVEFKRAVPGSSWLFERSNRDVPFIVPETSGWAQFTGMPESDRQKRTIELFRLGRTVGISSFRITSITWPVDGMIEIAKRLDQYENNAGKELSPAQQVAQAPSPALAGLGDDFWSRPEMAQPEMEVYTDPTTRKMGFRSKNKLIVLPAIYSSINPVEGAPGFLKVSQENTSGVQLFNNYGKKLTVNGYDSFYDIFAGQAGQIKLVLPLTNQAAFSSSCTYDYNYFDHDRNLRTEAQLKAFMANDASWAAGGCKKKVERSPDEDQPKYEGLPRVGFANPTFKLKFLPTTLLTATRQLEVINTEKIYKMSTW